MPDKDNRPPSPEAAFEQQRFGILPSDISFERFTDLLRIYDEVSGSRMVEDPYPGELEHFYIETGRSLQARNYAEWRFGSRLTGHSKFEAHLIKMRDGKQVVEFGLYDNLDPRATDTQKAEGEAMMLEYRKRANQYLTEAGVAVDLAEKPTKETDKPRIRKIYPWSVSATREMGWGFGEEQLQMLQYDDLDFLAEWLDEKSYGITPAILEILGHGNDRRAVELLRKLVALNPEHINRLGTMDEDTLEFWLRLPLDQIPADPSEIQGQKEYIQ